MTFWKDGKFVNLTDKMSHCKLCNFKFSKRGHKYNSASGHIKQRHNISFKEYYDRFYKEKEEGICLYCGENTPWNERFKYYNKHCSKICKSKEISSRENVKIKFKETMKTYFSDPLNLLKVSLNSSNKVRDPNSQYGKRFYKRWLYKNIYFKSSWELEFAKMCDNSNVKWEYEPERFILFGCRYYTPDFYLIDKNCYIEIKPDDLLSNFNGYSEEFERIVNKKLIFLTDKNWIERKLWIGVDGHGLKIRQPKI